MSGNIEKVKKIREITFSPVNQINKALQDSNGDVDKAIDLLIKLKQTSVEDINKRVANTNLVYSYVHNNRIGAMIVLACQTDFVARNELFLGLAKDICMHIVSTPFSPLYISPSNIPSEEMKRLVEYASIGLENKQKNILDKIVDGKLQKEFSKICLLNQPFVKNEDITIGEYIIEVISVLKEKIEIRKFIKMSSNSFNNFS